MADPTPPPARTAEAATTAAAAAKAAPKAKQNPALRMLGLPNLPSKLPSRNWLIFWGLSTSLAAAIVYDAREKTRATQRWAAAVAPLAAQPLADRNDMPRKITVYLEAQPGDGLRAAQDHFKEYVKPVLARSGLDWEFVVGRRQGDIRAAVAEHIRRDRRRAERAARPEPPKTEGVEDLNLEGTDANASPLMSSTTTPTTPTLTTTTPTPLDPELALDTDVAEEVRRRNGIAPYTGVRGDLVVGRTTWKEYVRGLHEGWLGPSRRPLHVVDEVAPAPAEGAPKRPPQPPPYNAVADYAASDLPPSIPDTLGPVAAVQYPHLLGFLNTPVRLWRFLHRRRVADDIGRQVAALCFATAVREFRPGEAEALLDFEEANWTKSVWAESDESAESVESSKDGVPAPPRPVKEKIWPVPVTIDERIGSRLRLFEADAAAEAAAQAAVVPEELIEGWTKGKLRLLCRWVYRKATGADKFHVYLGDLDADN